MKYSEFLLSKEKKHSDSGFQCIPQNRYAFDFQKDVTAWSLKKGKSAAFCDTGLGKTLMELMWGKEISKYEKKNVLIVSPLAVAKQTVREGQKFDIPVNYCRGQGEVKNGLNITNYEMIHHFDLNNFVGVAADESSILKSFDGKTTKYLIDAFQNVPYRYCLTATPAPNDYEELGNHAEILGVCSRVEMLAEFFVHDGGETSKWRLKGHAENDFWKWVASWAMVIKDPSDLGYDGSKYKLPPLNEIVHMVDSPQEELFLFVRPANTLDERRKARKESIEMRVSLAKEIAEQEESCLLWCDYNAESEALKNSIAGSVEVKGADSPEYKEKALLGFAEGNINYLVTKPKIAGFGMNWQNCNNMIFCGLSDSYESYYQAIRRCWRFGQTKPVNAHIIISEKETSVLENIKDKAKRAEQMSKNMIKITSEILKNEIKNTTRQRNTYIPKQEMKLPIWIAG